MTGRLASARTALDHQKSWFADLRRQVADGTPFALVNADAPQEIFRAAGMPYVVNQWWSSIISAKRLSGRYLGALREHGLPDDNEQYSALPLAEAMTGGDDRPYGGLPMPSLVLVERTGDGLHRMFDIWRSEFGVPVHVLESSAAGAVPVNWWDLMPRQWEQAVGTDRLDLLERELEAVADRVEALTGRPLSLEALDEVMRLSNEQAEWNRRTRDLIAAAPRCPIRVNDAIPAVMIPQWHRGTR
ncbi:2-hydroxyacyl-CoA dehydratase, partial [Actinomadura adrarensis]